MSHTKVPSHCVPCDCDCRQNIISMYHFENVIWNSFIQIWKTFRWPKSSKSRFGGGRNAQYAGWGWIALIPARQDHSQCYWGARRREAETAGSIRHEVETLPWRPSLASAHVSLRMPFLHVSSVQAPRAAVLAARTPCSSLAERFASCDTRRTR